MAPDQDGFLNTLINTNWIMAEVFKHVIKDKSENALEWCLC